MQTSRDGVSSTAQAVARSFVKQEQKGKQAGDGWLAALTNLEVEKLPGLAAEVSALTDPVLRRLRTHALLCRWLELAPEEAARWVRGKQDERWSLALYAAWAVMNPAAAFDSLRGEPAAKRKPFSDARDWRSEALSEVLRNGAAGFIRRGQLEPGFNPLDFPGADADRAALRALAGEDMNLTRRWAEGITDKTFSILTMRSLAGLLAEQQPEDAVAWAKSQSTPRAQQLMLEAIAPALAASDPERALAFVRENKIDGSLFETVEVIRRQGDEEALKWLARAQLHQKDDWVAHTVLRDLYARDPDKALELAIPFSGNPILGLTNFHEAEFPVAIDILKFAPDSAFRRGLMADAWSEWLNRDSQAAVAALAAAAGEPWAKYVRGALSESFTLRNIEVAAKLAGTPSGDAMGLNPSNVAVQVLGRDSAAATEIVTRVPGENNINVQNLARSWSGMDRAAAFEWMQTMPESSDHRRAAWIGFAQQWGKEDYAQFTQWVRSLPEGEDRRIGERMLFVVKPS
jgi:hypothetical protein